MTDIFSKFLSADDGFTLLGGETSIPGEGPFGYDFGATMQALGDVNGDGFDDIAIGAPSLMEDGGYRATGRVSVVYGGEKPEANDTEYGIAMAVVDPDAAPASIVTNLAPPDNLQLRLGATLSTGGDFNGDGLADTLLGGEAGYSYVIFGGSGVLAGDAGPSVDVARLSNNQGLALTLGELVRGGGDFNGDGLEDLISFDARAAMSSEDAVRLVLGSRAYVSFGDPDGPFTQAITRENVPDSGLVTLSVDAADVLNAGYVGDVNGDGLDDLGVVTSSGMQIVLGQADTPARIDPTALGAAEVIEIPSGRSAAVALTGIGDLDGDGFGDFYLSDGAERAIVWGAADGISEHVVPAADGTAGRLSLAELAAEDAIRLPGILSQSGLYNFSGRGAQIADLNGDGIGDLVWHDTDSVLKARLGQEDGWRTTVAEPGEDLRFVFDTGAGGFETLDLNGDGYADLAVSADGDVNIVYGTDTFTSNLPESLPGIDTPYQRLSTQLDVGAPFVPRGQPELSQDGRFTVFDSIDPEFTLETALAPRQIYVHDRVEDSLTLLTEGVAGDSSQARISGDGRYIVFEERSGAAGNPVDLWLLDRLDGTPAPLAPEGFVAPDGEAVRLTDASLSDDGRIVAFTSRADNPGLGDINGLDDVYALDRDTGTLSWLSRAASTERDYRGARQADVSADGTQIAFSADHRQTPVPEYEEFFTPPNIWLHDMASDAGRVVLSGASDPDLSQNGYFGYTIFRPDYGSGVARGSLTDADDAVAFLSRFGGIANGRTYDPTLSGDARYIVFAGYGFSPGDSGALWLGQPEAGGVYDIVVRDLAGGVLKGGDNSVSGPTLSRSGEYIAFSSESSVLDPLDVNGVYDIYLMRNPEFIADPEWLYGLSYLDDTFAAAPEGARVDGGLGHDSLTGSAMSDLLIGGAGDDTLTGGAGNDWLSADGGANSVDGGAGTDMVSFAGAERAIAADMITGRVVAGESISILTDVEGLTGSIFGDYIIGDTGENRLRGLGDYDWFVGSEGADTYDGGTGRDMVSYVMADTGVSVSLAIGGLSGQAAGDRYDSVERLTGSIFDDTFFGDAGENDFRGLGGRDTFFASPGGRERYDGGSGNDLVSYITSGSGVAASLQLGYGQAGDALRDLYTSIENLAGSAFDDRLSGDSGRNTLIGLDGDDFLFGDGGIDLLKGGLGNDVIDGGAASDYALFDGPRRDYEMFRTGSKDVRMNGPEGFDIFTNVEYFRFTDGDVRIWDLDFV